jgi:RNA polymerase sigma-32 factor
VRNATDVDTSIARYIAEVQRIPALGREEEHRLAVCARAGHEDAAAELVRANLRYVVPIAIGYRRYGVRLADLISEGNVGLMTALRKFDPDRGTRFVTYAAHWIRAYMLEHVIRAWSLVGIGSGPLRSKVFFRLRRERARIMASVNDHETVNERLAERFGTSIEKITLLSQRLDARDVSVDAKAHDDGTASVLDGMASSLPSPEERFFARERERALTARVRSAVAELDARERFIVEARIMAEAEGELSLAEIGRKLGVSRERARQIEVRAKAKLKKKLAQDGTLSEALEREAA